MQKKFRILRTMFVWIVISMVLQFSVYAGLNYRIANVMSTPDEPITTTLEASLPDTNPINVQVSYAKDYLAYTVNGTFKVFNLKQNKVVFTKAPVAGSDKNMGVLNYQWLPDRNILIYFYAKRNPNPYTTVVVPVTTEDKSEDTTKHSQEESGTHSTKTEVRANNPQLTELNTLELPDSSDETSQPDDRYNITLDSFPAGGQILQIVSSTYTNLIYVTIKTSTAIQLMEIDVMKTTRMLHKSGETIINMAASDRYGTLYVESKSAGTRQVLAVSGWKRIAVSKNSNYMVLGDRDGKLYIGEVKNGSLINILTGNDSADIDKAVTLTSIWQGNIPYTNERSIIGSSGQVIVYNDQKAFIITNGAVKEISLSGDKNYISGDGAELIQLFTDAQKTKVKLEPLQ